MASIRTGLGARDELSPVPFIERAAEFGCDHVELMMQGHADRGWLAEHGRRMTDAAETHGVDLLFHLPHGTVTDIGSPHEELRTGARRELAECIRVAGRVGGEKGILHAQSTYGTPRMADFEAVRRQGIVDGVTELVVVADEHGVELCVENVIENTLPTREFDVLFEETAASMTFDTGKAYREGLSEPGMAEFVATHPDRISHFHLNDAEGSNGHLPFGFGALDFGTILEPLEEHGWTGTLTLEAGTLDFDYLRLSKRKLDELL